MNENNGFERYLLPEPEEVILPSGMQVVLRQPTIALYLRRGFLPTSLLLASRGDTMETTPVDVAVRTQELIEWAYSVIEEVFVRPRFSMMETGEGVFHPSRLRSEDWLFVSQWVARKSASLKVGGGDVDLESFRGGASRDDAGSGASRGTME